MTTTPRTFVWYELMTIDLPAAETFYKAAIGWTAQPWGAPGQYSLMSAGDAPVAGLMPLPAEARASGGQPGWLGYVGVEDVDAAVERAKQAGGAVHRAPADIPEIGRFAVVADPQGAPFIVFKPAGGERPPASPMTPGHVGWHELYAADWPAAFDFYAGQFGWTKDQPIDMGPMGTYQLFAAGGSAIGGMMTRQDATRPPGWRFYFSVEDIDAAEARIGKAGGRITTGPMEVPGGAWILECLDPQGAEFAVVGMRGNRAG